jgi:hypothetical protein
MVITFRRVRTSLNLVPCIHLNWSRRLAFSSILLQISDDETSIEARQEGGKHWDSSWWTHGYVDIRREVLDGHAIPIQNVVIHGGKRRWSWVTSSRARRAAYDDHRLRVPSRPQELGDHVSNGHQATNYDKSDRRFSATTDWDSIDNYPIIRVSP